MSRVLSLLHRIFTLNAEFDIEWALSPVSNAGKFAYAVATTYVVGSEAKGFQAAASIIQLEIGLYNLGCFSNHTLDAALAYLKKNLVKSFRDTMTQAKTWAALFWIVRVVGVSDVATVAS